MYELVIQNLFTVQAKEWEIYTRSISSLGYVLNFDGFTIRNTVKIKTPSGLIWSLKGYKSDCSKYNINCENDDFCQQKSTSESRTTPILMFWLYYFGINTFKGSVFKRVLWRDVDLLLFSINLHLSIF